MTSSNPKTPLLEDAAQAIREAYGTSDCATFMNRGECVIDYKPKKLASFRVCCVRRGTILTNPVLFVEQAMLTAIFVSFAFLTYYTVAAGAEVGKDGEVDSKGGLVDPSYQVPDVSDQGMDDSAYGQDSFLFFASHHHLGGITLSRWIRRQEPKMRAFAMIMTSIGTFLMALYTSMSVSRWWMIRTHGIGGIKAATVDLEWTICQLVTQDETVLSAVRRYGRASLKLVFLWRRQEENGPLSESDKELLQTDGLLTENEVNQLKGLKHCLHETIWAWQISIVTMLRQEGLVKSDSVYQLLMNHCEMGRMAVQCIHTHLAVRIPMQYVHLLGFVVKLHNLILAVIMGTLFGVTIKQREFIICCQLFGRTLILPFLFNAILLMNAELGDPFDGTGVDDFPDQNLIAGLGKDCNAFVKASQNLPPWIMDRSSTPKGAEEA
jgi:hypothetical protein